MLCHHEGCRNRAEDPDAGRHECFKHRVSGVAFQLRGGAVLGKSGFHTTKSEWLKEHLGTSSEKELAKRGNIERA